MKWATQVLSWISTLLIARILSPTDYGLVGMATVVLGFIGLLNEFGLTAAILRERRLPEDELARLGGFGLALGVGLAARGRAAVPERRHLKLARSRRRSPTARL